MIKQKRVGSLWSEKLGSVCSEMVGSIWTDLLGSHSLKFPVTHAYLKKQNKTDPNEIKVARKIKNGFEAYKATLYKQQKKPH
jgi:hypothetical protein